MNKEQIKKELRRSACNDFNPAAYCGFNAFEAAFNFLDHTQDQWTHRLSYDDCRTYFLIVAEAL